MSSGKRRIRRKRAEVYVRGNFLYRSEICLSCYRYFFSVLSAHGGTSTHSLTLENTKNRFCPTALDIFFPPRRAIINVSSSYVFTGE